jgi:hypothetical protein
MLGVVVGVLPSCAVTPQVPLGPPLAPNEVAIRSGWGTSFGRATARVRDGDGVVHEIVGNGDSTQGVQPLNPGLVMLEFVGARMALAPRWDAGVYAGWNGGGAGARYRLTTPESALGAYLGLDGQVGYMKPTALRVPYAGRVLMEGAVGLGPEFQLLGNLGLSGGRRRHGLELASALNVDAVDAPPFVAVRPMAVERGEVRIEGALGAALDLSRVVVGLLLMPYAVVAHGPARGACPGRPACESLIAYEQSFGFSVLVDVAVRVRGRSATVADAP